MTDTLFTMRCFCLTLLLGLTLTACGQKGPLVMPEEPAPTENQGQ